MAAWTTSTAATGRTSRVRPASKPANSITCSTISVSRRPSPAISWPYRCTCSLSRDHAVGEVLGGRSDHRERRAEFVRHAGDELHLLRGQRAGARIRDHQHARCSRRAAAARSNSRTGCGDASMRPRPRAIPPGARSRRATAAGARGDAARPPGHARAARSPRRSRGSPRAASVPRRRRDRRARSRRVP